MNAVLIPARLVAIIGGTFLVVKAIARWVYRDEFDPDAKLPDFDKWEAEMEAEGAE